MRSGCLGSRCCGDGDEEYYSLAFGNFSFVGIEGSVWMATALWVFEIWHWDIRRDHPLGHLFGSFRRSCGLILVIYIQQGIRCSITTTSSHQVNLIYRVRSLCGFTAIGDPSPGGSRTNKVTAGLQNGKSSAC